MRVQCSIACFAAIPALNDVPHATTTILLIARIVSVSHFTSSRFDPALFVEAAAHRVSDRIGLLVDLLEHEVLVAALLGGLEVPIDVNLLGLDLVARRSRRSSPNPAGLRRSGDRSAALTSRVCCSSAGMSDADQSDPVGCTDDDRRLRASGDDHIRLTRRGCRRARTRPSGSPPLRGPPPAASNRRRSMIDSIRWAATSVSVSDLKMCPSSASCARSTSWFSMIPLCTSASFAGAVLVWVRVLVGRSTVCRPARVTDPEGAVERPGLAELPRGSGSGRRAERVPTFPLRRIATPAES